ncbi:MAG: acyltransferase family protein [Isosphaeraceae bacterium]
MTNALHPGYTSGSKTRARVVKSAAPAPSRSPQLGSHLPALDSLRGIAVLSVMLYHFNHGPNDAGGIGAMISKLFRLGGSGVDLFFVLSGFLITGILIDSKHDRHYFRNFYIRRSLRVFPLYYAMLAVCCVVLPCLGLSINEATIGEQGWLWFYGTNLLQAWRESYVFGGFSHFWSLAVEEHFYLLWPLIIFACSRKTGIWACLACMLLAIACRIGLVMAGGHAISAYVLTPCRMDALALGGLIAFGMRIQGEPGWLVRAAVTSLVVTCSVLMYLFIVKIDMSKMDGPVLVLRSTLSAGFFGAILILAVNAPQATLAGRCCNIRFLRFFGKYSYGLYVFHYPLIPLFDRLFPSEYLATCLSSVLLGRLVYTTLAISMSVLVAMLSWHAYEKHFVGLKDLLAPRGR